jgi:hypothetical protein
MASQLVQNQIELYREAWARDYQTAQACHECEEYIRLGLHLFSELKRYNQLWRQDVYQGVKPLQRETHLQMKRLFSTWLEVSSNLLRQSVIPLQKNYDVNGAALLQAAQLEAIEIIHTWKLPKLSRLAGMHTQTLGAEASAELRQHGAGNTMTDPSQASPMLQIDGDEFLKSKRKPKTRMAV